MAQRVASATLVTSHQGDQPHRTWTKYVLFSFGNEHSTKKFSSAPLTTQLCLPPHPTASTERPSSAAKSPASTCSRSGKTRILSVQRASSVFNNIKRHNDRIEISGAITYMNLSIFPSRNGLLLWCLEGRQVLCLRSCLRVRTICDI